ncbi:unnamed protein product [Schistosoma curassoni]|nr:unnamed protein product [Schistosoma curassoni]
MYDRYKNFNLIFILGGLSVFISGLLCLPLAKLSKWENRELYQSNDNEMIYDKTNDQSLYPIRLLRRIRDWFNKHFQCSKHSNDIY